jgi:glycosyltransferase involved in cell wall biosynthesis
MTKKIRIGIDARCLEGKLTGIGRYTYELCMVLDACMQSAEFFLYSQNPISVILPSSRWHLRIENNDWAKKIKGILWLKYVSGKYIKRDCLDVYWGSSTFLPNIPNSVLTISTVYDLNHIVVPQTMPFFTKIAHNLYFERDIKCANLVLSISTGTKVRLKNIYGIEVAQIIKPAVSEIFHIQQPSEIIAQKNKYNLCNPFFLTVATKEPRKNIINLIRAFGKIHEIEEFKRFELVLVGEDGWGAKELNIEISNGVASGYLKVLGYVNYSDLPGLYGGAEAFIFPSIYEGYGMPAREALVCGANVITTNIPELREATDEQATYVSPSIDAIYQGMIDVLTNTSISNKERIRSIGVENNSWSIEGKKFADTIYKLIEKRAL